MGEVRGKGGGAWEGRASMGMGPTGVLSPSFCGTASCPLGLNWQPSLPVPPVFCPDRYTGGPITTAAAAQFLASFLDGTLPKTDLAKSAGNDSDSD